MMTDLGVDGSSEIIRIRGTQSIQSHRGEQLPYHEPAILISILTTD
jgi:hypothetical protein